MAEEEKIKEKLNILVCPACSGTGFVNWQKCKECHHMQMGFTVRNKWLYWGYPLTREFFALERGRRILEKIRIITALVFAIGSLILLGWLLYKSNIYLQFIQLPEYWPAAYLSLTPAMMICFWFAIISFTYIWYRSIRKKEFLGEVEQYKYDFEQKDEKNIEAMSWEQVFKLSGKHKKNIARAFSEEARVVIGDSFNLADNNNHQEVDSLHLFYILLGFNRIANIFVRLGISTSVIQKQLVPLFASHEQSKVEKKIQPLISDSFKQIIFGAYESAYSNHMEFVSVTELLIMCIEESEFLKELILDLGVNEQKLANVVQWARIREKLYHQYVKFSRAASHRSKHGMDKAMTAVATPYLNNFSEDMTLMAQYGHLKTCVAREKEWEEMFRVVEGGQQNVLLVGDNGVGKRTIIEGLAQKMVSDDVPDRLKDKRLVRMNISSLLAGTTASGAVERLQRMMYEMGKAGNIILYIHNIHELIGVTAGNSSTSLDVSDTLSQYLTSGRFLTIADTTNQFHAQSIVNSPLGNVFSKVSIEEMDENQAIQVLESKAGSLEYKHKVFFAYNSIEKAVQLAKRYLHDTYLPGNALEIMTESAAYTRNKKGMNTIVTAEEVAIIVAEKTNIPVTSVSDDESAKLLKLEQEMHKRVIGQNEAVDSVANALRRSRVEIRSTNRPISNFLFLGPTGVGKTELAKTIAEIYFGGEERMIRVDMSEYQDNTSIYRLIGQPGQQGSGILTEAVRQNAFSLVLFDEIEKADPNVLNLFLQIMDDGRLTDSTGRVVDFTNVIIIATSNAGTAFVQDQIMAGIESEVIKEKLMHGQLRESFRPEFLNRFDGIILFKALERDDIRQIAGLMLKRVAGDLEKKGIELKVEETALDYLADVGFDKEFGARPMRRAIQDKVENQLAGLLLAGKLKRRDVVVIGQGGEVRVE